MASDGGQVRRLARDEGEAEIIPSWSGDGKWIHYAGNRTGRFEIWKRPAQGGPATQLTHNGGRSLYYTSYVHDSGRQGEIFTTAKTGNLLWVLPLGGGKEKQVLESV